ncbi:heterokaryon incompatibility protein (HET) domain-containing protein [Hirsutella rhossiliensis]|uniref:Heterokaryon incompatibility protein (HET) domain-containing protein n=1 Tax=Hirsutella rhossiliensis TaxID=111463 RepID=A0A9P8SCB9_9HYPO|nr:heterokaryon incompatibility protein (HET) domain-containing protein [Hirsutella rhossiliensis]KAH0957391.1 heterokaryon incompatibility protein (HET) domain-containing protein [Hirsutella rhossiliensis]
MRLLNVYTLGLTTFMGADEDIPPYAILSHTWDQSEVTFEDMQSCARASRDGLDYIWIDTCCIDKSSRAELSEAINSMFRWYQQSSVCYVYLKDFEVSGRVDFCASRWFDRGWTLQELIAPRNVVFLDQKWVFTSRHCMCSSEPLSSLRNGKCEACNAKDNLPDILGSLNASVIMGWAANRSTTRTEDAAYSLIGLFNVSMPLLYGERDRAFMRLQEAILARSNDHSILLWRAKPDSDGGRLRPGCLARSPKAFAFAPPIVPQREYYDFENEMIPRLAVGLSDNAEPMQVSETMLTVTLWLCPCRAGHPFDDVSPETPGADDWTLGILNCNSASDYFVRPAILLSHMGANLYRRIACDAIFLVNPRSLPSTPVTTTLSIYHRHPNTPDPGSNWTVIEHLSMEQGLRKQVKLLVRPAGRTPGKAYSSRDAVCCVVNQPQRCCHSVTTRIVGGYPTIYSHDSLPPTVPMLRGLVKYDCSRGLGLIGGIHLFEVAVPAVGLRVGIYVIWGLHHHHPVLHQGVQQSLAEKPWCRLFDSTSFGRDSGIPIREHEGDDLRYQKQLYTWLLRNSRDANWQVMVQRGLLKKVLPDLADGERSAADRMLDLFPESEMRMGLSARMNMVQGLGIRSNDIELTLFTPECSGWRSDAFDGSQKDQVLEYDPSLTSSKQKQRLRLWSRWPARKKSGQDATSASPRADAPGVSNSS